MEQMKWNKGPHMGDNLVKTRKSFKVCLCSNILTFSIISHFSQAFLARVLLFRTLKESSRDLSLFKFKSGAVVLFVVLGLLNSLFEGKAVAKLLFKLFGFVMKMSHRELQGEDLTDCSTLFASSIGAKVAPRPASMLVTFR
ncbi:uncharacterized protein LOC125473263 [Pyrus x bretschneideri]|uniref:uncharacterized protein LOC125473263 n=1 Tax=Pyrus x bretschneideri TaxID=225117 RepID=UPI00202EDB29|nr:uncharacterized protein LOC125473263 [Pyrus x bretschneideri]XP_048431801.1 uncharacterized protein LOC125473263 [Pyrus x bretschneideri]